MSARPGPSGGCHATGIPTGIECNPLILVVKASKVREHFHLPRRAKHAAQQKRARRDGPEEHHLRSYWLSSSLTAITE
jgi:hypothetical protein